MAHIITMPKLGLTMTEGTITKWCKSEGEAVKAGDILFEVSTDKITNQVEAETEGVLLKILVNEGQEIAVIAPVGILGSAGEDISGVLKETGAAEASEKVEEKEEAAAAVAAEAPAVVSNGFIKASPAAKKMARDNNIDLLLLKGTGPEGRIVEKDVKTYIEDNSSRIKVSPVAGKMAKDMGVDLEAIGKQGRIMKDDIIAAAQPKAAAPVMTVQEDTRVVPSGIRKVIAERMSASWSISPRVTYNLELDVTNMKAFRSSLKDACAAEGAKLSFNHILMKICAKALTEFPYINASFDGKEIILHKDVNIGLAVALDNDGLIVPNVKGVQSKSVLEIAKETEDKIEAARKGALKPDDMTGGTFTITNIGMYGIESFSPIINQPELAILGVNAIIEKPVVVDGQIVIRPMMNLSLTADHRVIDGAMAAKFMARIKQLVENPYLLMI